MTEPIDILDIAARRLATCEAQWRSVLAMQNGPDAAVAEVFALLGMRLAEADLQVAQRLALDLALATNGLL